MMQFMIEPATMESHGHTLGVVSSVMRSYCAACKAGGSMCYHRSSLLWMQYNHWGKRRHTPKPATSAFCSWIPGSGGHSKRTFSTIVPAGKLIIEKLPCSETETNSKLERGRNLNLKEGADALYGVFGGDRNKNKLIEDPEYTNAECISILFGHLRVAHGNINAEDSDTE